MSGIGPADNAEHADDAGPGGGARGRASARPIGISPDINRDPGEDWFRGNLWPPQDREALKTWTRAASPPALPPRRLVAAAFRRRGADGVRRTGQRRLDRHRPPAAARRGGGDRGGDRRAARDRRVPRRRPGRGAGAARERRRRFPRPADLQGRFASLDDAALPCRAVRRAVPRAPPQEAPHARPAEHGLPRADAAHRPARPSRLSERPRDRGPSDGARSGRGDARPRLGGGAGRGEEPRLGAGSGAGRGQHHDAPHLGAGRGAADGTLPALAHRRTDRPQPGDARRPLPLRQRGGAVPRRAGAAAPARLPADRRAWHRRARPRLIPPRAPAGRGAARCPARRIPPRVARAAPPPPSGRSPPRPVPGTCPRGPGR